MTKEIDEKMSLILKERESGDYSNIYTLDEQQSDWEKCNKQGIEYNSDNHDKFCKESLENTLYRDGKYYALNSENEMYSFDETKTKLDDGKVEVEVVIFDEAERPSFMKEDDDFGIEPNNTDRFYISVSLYNQAVQAAQKESMETEQWLSNCVESALTRIVNMSPEDWENFSKEGKLNGK